MVAMQMVLIFQKSNEACFQKTKHILIIQLINHICRCMFHRNENLTSLKNLYQIVLNNFLIAQIWKQPNKIYNSPDISAWQNTI